MPGWKLYMVKQAKPTRESERKSVVTKRQFVLATGLWWGLLLGVPAHFFIQIDMHGFSLDTIFSLHFLLWGMLSIAYSFAFCCLWGLILWHWRLRSDVHNK